MKPSFDNFKINAKEIRMNEKDKKEIRNFLIETMRTGDVRAAIPAGQGMWSAKTHYSFYSFLRPMPIAFILVLLVGGSGVSYAAEGSLPGEVLYPVKVHVNESVRGWVSVSEEAKADWEARRALRRLEEAEKLAVAARLNEETRVQIEANFERHANKVEERIEKFEERDTEKAAEVTAHFEVSLNAHARILENIATGVGSSTQVEVNKLLIKVKTEKNNAGEQKEKAEIKVRAQSNTEVEASARGKGGAARNKIDEAKKFLERVKVIIGAEATLRAEARLKVAEDLYLEGQAQLAAGAYGEAFILFQKAFGAAQEVKLLLEAKTQFDEGENDEGSNAGATTSIEIHTSDDDDDNDSSNNGLHLKVEGDAEGSTPPARARGQVEIDLSL